MTRNPIARNMHKANKPAVIPDKRNKLLQDEYEQFEHDIELDEQRIEDNSN